MPGRHGLRRCVPGVDVWLPYYRDLGVVLVAGLTPYEVFLGVFSKADDPSSGGRQMPSHWGSRRLGIVSHSSPIATQVPHAAGHRLRDAVPGRGRRRRLLVRRGCDERGRLARGAELRRDPRAAGRVHLREQRVRDQRAPGSSRWRCAMSPTARPAYGMPGVVVDGSDVLACYAAMREAPTARAPATARP